MNGFKEHEIVLVQGRSFPVIGGRLRIVHENNQKLSITTELIAQQLEEFAIVRARVETATGVFTGTGVATANRDPKLTESLLELSETRAVARALRFAGIGVESCGLEELGAGPILEGTAPRQETGQINAVATITKPTNGNGSRSNTPASSAQLRCIRTLARKLAMEPDEVVAKVIPGLDLEGLSLSQASTVINTAKSKLGANGDGGESYVR